MTTPSLVLGYIGLGNMGAPMAWRLVDAGFEVHVWNRTPDKMEPLVTAGARAAESAAAVAEAADVIGICLFDTASVEAQALGLGGLVEAKNSPGTVVLDFTTIDPQVTRRIAARVSDEAGIEWIDAPVSGGVPGAEQGILSIFAGAEATALERAKPFLDCVADRVTHMGPSGAGQLTKACNQLLTGVTVMSIAEMIALARRAGVQTDRLIEALTGGSADSRLLQQFGPGMIAREFEPTRSGINTVQKDLATVQEIARSVGAATPISALADALYRSIDLRGDIDGTEDVSALIKLYEQAPPRT